MLRSHMPELKGHLLELTSLERGYVNGPCPSYLRSRRVPRSPVP